MGPPKTPQLKDSSERWRLWKNYSSKFCPPNSIVGIVYIISDGTENTEETSIGGAERCNEKGRLIKAYSYGQEAEDVKRTPWSVIMKIKTRCCVLVVLVYALFNCVLLLYSTVLNESAANRLHFSRIGKTRQLAEVEQTRSPPFLESHSKTHITYRINRKGKCFNDPTVTLLIIISSSPEEGARRIAMRETWAGSRVSDSVGSTVVCLFLLGPTDNFILRKEIDEESNKYHDVVQADAASHGRYDDDLITLHWVRHYCINSRFLLTVDDRTLAFTDRLVPHLTQISKTDFFGCLLSRNSTHGNFKRGSHSLDVSTQPYHLPSFKERSCLLSIDVALRVAILSQELSRPLFANTTLLYYSRKLNLPVSNLERFQVYDSNRSLCELKSAFLISDVGPASMYNLWEDLRDQRVNSCNGTAERSKHFSKIPLMIETSRLHDVSLRADFSHARNTVDDDIFLLVLFQSDSRNENRRSIIRKTGGMFRTVRGKKVVQLFLVGAPPTAEVESKVKSEGEHFKDIIVINTDDHSDPSLKVSILLKLAALFLPPARYVMKVEDDAFIRGKWAQVGRRGKWATFHFTTNCR
ncbi:beta-1,3-galactosyltransferase 5-like [Ptychodera flava]|uniref:beta-1,3-galactosyltransferase 5-like n=1 Tax=Ptychodera flava TaxID=63121 RepID=UPI003969EDEB